MVGQRIREATKATTAKEAGRLLRERQATVDAGKPARPDDAEAQLDAASKLAAFHEAHRNAPHVPRLATASPEKQYKTRYKTP